MNNPTALPVDAMANARAIARDLAKSADEVERTRRIPADLLARMHELRLCKMLLPKSTGGDEIHPGLYLQCIEELSQHNSSVGWNVFVANSAALIAPYLEPETAQMVFGPPNALVAWGPPNATLATIEPGGYRVTGEWSFASGSRQATWMGLHCMVQKSDGLPRLNANGHPEIRSMLFPVDQATQLDTWNTIGLRGTASDSYRVENLFVADAFTGSRETPDASREPGPLYAFTMQGIYAVGVAGVALGIARAMLEAFKELATTKTPRGLDTLADRAGVQSGVARSEARIGSARAYLLEALREIYAAAQPSTSISTEDRARVRLGASNAIHGAVEVADWVYHEAGVSAIFPGSPFERRFRDIHTVSQQIQSRDAHYETVGQVLLDRPPAVFY
jgi:alkylation response protein AidB-like acyl-CoA dehydrogenase